jgi:signal transduction histidine kinase/DNA-binding response OmpR family regulator
VLTIIDAPNPLALASSPAIGVVDADDLLGVGTGTDILVVDDDAATLAAYEAALEPLGRRMVLAPSGMHALARLLEQDFALLLLDVSMPDMSGIETARRIRERPRNRGLPIIFITGIESSPPVMLEAYDAGAIDFVIKPILPEVLRAKVRVYLQLQERTQALARESAQLREAHRLLSAADEKLRERDAATRAAHRLQKLQDATAALAQANTPAEVAAAAVRLGADAVNASAACMWIAQPDGSLTVEACQGVPEQVLDPWRVIPDGAETPATRVLRSRRPLWIENETDFAREAPAVYEEARRVNRVAALAVLPLIRGDRGIGVLSFGFAGEHAFAPEERAFLIGLAQTCQQVLDRSRDHVAEGMARRSAEEANRRKDEFLAMLSHELRNPLWAMVNALELIKARMPIGRELTILERQIDHLTHIVDDLLDLSRITRGKIQLQREAVELVAVIAAAVETARPAIEHRGHTLTVRVPDDLRVDADRHRLQQVVDNLLANAVKYTTDRGRIEISAEPEDALVRIVVRDNGRGITEALLPDVFQPFVQGEQALDRSDGGLGIGLTLVETLVDLHGGTIEAHSDGPGTGATFTVRWPGATAGAAAPAPRLIAASAHRQRILIVDDNADAADMLAALLRMAGHEVSVANHGATALELARDFAPQVALLDLGLPEIDGFELAHRLRGLDICRDTVLIAVTGYGQPGDRRRSKAAGFAHHLVKPVALATLEALLAEPGAAM